MLLPEPIVEQHGSFSVVRDDLLEGGSKMRFLPFLCGNDGEELVFGGPFCGGAPLALSVIGKRLKRKVTLFYAARKDLHRRQKQAMGNGARLEFVRPGYITVVQARARAYATAAGARFLPLGFDLPAAEEPFVAAMVGVRRRLGGADEVWCAAGSGMMTRCLSKAFPEAAVHAVTVGLASRHEAQAFGPNVTLHSCSYKFEQECKEGAPFPSCPNYDRKAWSIAQEQVRGRGIFWNVAA